MIGKKFAAYVLSGEHSPKLKHSFLLRTLLVPTLFAGLGGAMSQEGGLHEKAVGGVESMAQNIFNPAKGLSNILSFGPAWGMSSGLTKGLFPGSGMIGGMYGASKLMSPIESVLNVKPEE